METPRGAARVAGAPAGEPTAPPRADVLLLAPDLHHAQALVQTLTASGLSVDRAVDAEDVEVAVELLSPPTIVVLATDDMLARARVRRVMAADPAWRDLPVVEVGLGALERQPFISWLARRALEELAGGR